MTDKPAQKKAPAVAKTAAVKPVVAKQPAAKPAPKASSAAIVKKPAIPAPKPSAAPVAVVSIAPMPVEKAAQLKMKDLIERVVKATGGKKKGVKEIVEATLASLGDALAKGEAINLPGFGRAKVAHAEDKGAGKPMTIKMKSQPAGDAKKPRKLPLAAPQD